MKPALDQVLGELIRADKRDYIKLQKGLVIAFTPSKDNDGPYRLCLSRPKPQKPSKREGEIVLKFLGVALAESSLDYEVVRNEETAVSGQPCIVIEWKPLRQPPLFAELPY
ncbi:MAG: hypothetical protein AAF614_11635 [Chloroflexota bacterium]